MPRKAQKPNQPQHSQRAKLVEEFCILDLQVQNFKPVSQRHEKLRKLILEWYLNVPPEQEISVAGVTYDILITSKDRVRSVSLEGKRKLFKLWGAQDFIAKATVLLKSLDDPEDDEGLYTIQALTGPRHLHVIGHGKAAAAESAA